MYSYLIELGLAYRDILEHVGEDEAKDVTKILENFFKIFKQEIYQENKEKNSWYFQIKKLYHF